MTKEIPKYWCYIIMLADDQKQKSENIVKKYDEKKLANEVTAGGTTHCLRESRKPLL